MGWWILAGVALLAAFCLSWISNWMDEANRKKQSVLAEHQRREAWEAAQRNLALTCRRCQALAPPIPGTGNRYKCGACGNQFAAARHKQ